MTNRCKKNMVELISELENVLVAIMNNIDDDPKAMLFFSVFY
jgi:hypothetical protein